jgi:hypothetical protein
MWLIHVITIGSSGNATLAEVFCPSSGCGAVRPAKSSILVNTQFAGGAALSGIRTILQQGGQTVASGFTPVNFSITSGQTYAVMVSDNPTRAITLNGNAEYVATYVQA